MDDDATVSDDAPPKFPKRYFCLRGSFIFYYDLDDVDASSSSYGYDGGTKFKAAPLGVIPLERTKVEFPQGGRRVFREHAKTDARSGYEMMIRHVPRRDANDAGGDGASVVGSGTVTGMKKEKRRAPAYLVCDSSGQRDKWKAAIELRNNFNNKPTKLRPTGTNALNLPTSSRLEGYSSKSPDGAGLGGRRGGRSSTHPPSPRRVGGEISVLAGVIEAGEQKDIDEALQQFGGKTLFDEARWVNEFFESREQTEGAEMCAQLERWQTSIKKGLRGAVLEQYEYFVEASREMTILGREVATLKELGNKQMETFESMKRVNFDLDFLGNDPPRGIGDTGDNSMTEDETTRYSSDSEGESASGSRKQSTSRDGGRMSSGSRKSTEASIEIPEYLEDVVEEIGAFVKECRYTDATDLLQKAKSEVNEIINSVSDIKWYQISIVLKYDLVQSNIFYSVLSYG